MPEGPGAQQGSLDIDLQIKKPGWFARLFQRS